MSVQDVYVARTRRKTSQVADVEEKKKANSRKVLPRGELLRAMSAAPPAWWFLEFTVVSFKSKLVTSLTSSLMKLWSKKD